MSDVLEAVKISGEWAKQLALWTTGALVLSLGFLKDFVKGQNITGGWWVCLSSAWFLLMFSLICGHLAFGAPLTGAGKDPGWRLTLNDQTRWLSRFQLITFVLGVVSLAVFVAFHVSAGPSQRAAVPQMWKPIACVGPFASGKSNRLEQDASVSNRIHCQDISSSVKLIQESCGNTDKCQLILVGSADKRPLHRDSKIEFGSNEGLARGRAEWVREQLVTALSLDPNHFLVLTIGPREHGVIADVKQLQFDRSVRIYLLGPGEELSNASTASEQ